MTQILKAACVQIDSGANIQNNLEKAASFIHQAVKDGAEFVATPEVTDQVISNRAEVMEQSFLEQDHPGLPFFSELAKDLSITLLIGSMSVRQGEEKIANRSYLFDPQGQITARYDKIHLYDVDLPSGESHRESKIFKAGKGVVTVDVQSCKLGMSICYDIRFPHLYRKMAKMGAQILSIPAAFTVPTGQAHWETLLRARAIETGSFVIAPAQCGTHQGARQTYGHSMIIGPWGEILASIGDGEGIIMAELDMQMVQNARQAIPALLHDQEIE